MRTEIPITAATFSRELGGQFARTESAAMRNFVCLLLTAACFVSAGCEVKTNPAIDLLRTRLSLDKEPTDATSIEQAKSRLATDSPPRTVTIKGHVDLDAYASIGNNKALILIREMSEDEHGQDSGHDPSTCPFCRRRLEAAPKAVVEFVGDDGKVLPYSAATLFGLKQYDVVVVQGQADLDSDLDILKITAAGIYRPEP